MIIMLVMITFNKHLKTTYGFKNALKTCLPVRKGTSSSSHYAFPYLSWTTSFLSPSTGRQPPHKTLYCSANSKTCGMTTSPNTAVRLQSADPRVHAASPRMHPASPSTEISASQYLNTHKCRARPFNPRVKFANGAALWEYRVSNIKTKLSFQTYLQPSGNDIGISQSNLQSKL